MLDLHVVVIHCKILYICKLNYYLLQWNRKKQLILQTTFNKHRHLKVLLMNWSLNDEIFIYCIVSFPLNMSLRWKLKFMFIKSLTPIFPSLIPFLIKSLYPSLCEAWFLKKACVPSSLTSLFYVPQCFKGRQSNVGFYLGHQIIKTPPLFPKKED